MRKPLLHTKVTVKLRKSIFREEWYLYIESYPVRNPGSTKPKRVIEAVNRTITTPIWDMTAISKIDEDGNYKYKPKRDSNGIIQCTSQLDKEACRYADKVRALRQQEYDTAVVYSDREQEMIAQNERSERCHGETRMKTFSIGPAVLCDMPMPNIILVIGSNGR